METEMETEAAAETVMTRTVKMAGTVREAAGNRKGQ
jgi:hypothetical protein